MTAEEIEEYAKVTDASPVVIRKCEKCGQDRILETSRMEAKEGTGEWQKMRHDHARCGCGLSPLDDADAEALEGRGP